MKTFIVKNVSRGISSKLNRAYRNKIVDFSYRTGQRWNSIRLAPDEEKKILCHELNQKAKILEKAGAISIDEVLTQQNTVPIKQIMPELVDAVSEMVEELTNTAPTFLQSSSNELSIVNPSIYVTDEATELTVESPNIQDEVAEDDIMEAFSALPKEDTSFIQDETQQATEEEKPARKARLKKGKTQDEE